MKPSSKLEENFDTKRKLKLQFKVLQKLQLKTFKVYTYIGKNIYIYLLTTE